MTLSPMLAFTIPVPSLINISGFVGALLLCAGLTNLVLRYQRGFGFDKPDDHRKKHGHTISRLGGLPIFLTLMGGIIMTNLLVPATSFSLEWWPLILTNTIVFAIGFLDDLRPLGARVKFIGQIGAAFILYAMGQSIDYVTHPTAHTHIALGWMSSIVTVLWLISIPNIINLIDGMDGLATGFGLFLSLTLAFVGHFGGMPDIVMICTVMAGALAGFLLFNLPPAKIFLGDGGAYLIGFFIASVSLTSSQKGYILGALLVIVIALGVPILDTLFAVIRRAVRGVPLFRADAEHLHHRLIALGFSKGQALGIMYAVCAVLSLIGILVLTKRGMGMVVATAALAVITLVAARSLGYVKSFRGLKKQFGRALYRRREFAYAQALGRVLEMESDRAESAAEFASLLDQKVTRIGFSLKPELGRVPCSLRLKDGRFWQLGVMTQDRYEDHWRAQLETLLSGLERALERWPDLPGIKIETALEPAGAANESNHDEPLAPPASAS